MTPEEIIAQRESTHGDFTDNSAVAQSIKTIIRHSVSHLSDVQAEALDFIASKIGRICSGNANERDHWVDIAGYATLVADRIPVVPDHPEIPGLFQHPPIPTGWRVMQDTDRIDTLSRVNCRTGWLEFHPSMYGRELHQWRVDTAGGGGYTVITPDWHNPCNVESPGEDYRFLLKGEKRTPDLQVWCHGSSWAPASAEVTQPLFNEKTYRTKCPLPTIA